MTTASQTLEPDLSGQTLERYRLIRRLGIGGMGAVYEAEHTKLEKRVAVKVLRAEFTLQEIARKRFLREAKAATRVKHPNVVDISDFGETEDGRVYFVMELLAGKDLSELVKAKQRLPWERAQKIFLQVISALDAAHAQGIVHRDMKPSNCFMVDIPGMEGTDFIKVLDFGIAKISGKVGEETEGLTSTDEVFGTVAYMAPEMAMGTTNDPRSDIYAVGVMMYRMLVGDLPFNEGNAFQILSQHINMPPPRPRAKEPSIPEAIEAVILKALEKRADDRFQTMKDLAEAVRLGRLVDKSPGIEATALAPNTAAAPGGTAVVHAMGSASQPWPAATPPSTAPGSEQATAHTGTGPSGVMSGGGTGPVHPSGAVPTATGPVHSSGAMAMATGPVHPSGAMPLGTGPVHPSGAIALGTGSVPVQQKNSGVLIALLAVVTVGVVIGAVMLGMLLANKGKDEAPGEVASSSTPSPLPAQQASPEAKSEPPPTETKSQPPADEIVAPPTGTGPAGDTKPATPPDEPKPTEGAADDAAPSDATKGSETNPASGSDSGGSRPKKTKPKTDEAVIAGLKRRIENECSEGGGTTVRLEGLIRPDGGIQGALATPKAGPGACAEKILKSASFARREARTPMPMFSVKL